MGQRSFIKFKQTLWFYLCYLLHDLLLVSFILCVYSIYFFGHLWGHFIQITVLLKKNLHLKSEGARGRGTKEWTVFSIGLHVEVTMVDAVLLQLHSDVGMSVNVCVTH